MKKLIFFAILMLFIYPQANAIEEIQVIMYDESIVKQEGVHFLEVDGYIIDNKDNYTSQLNGERIKDPNTNMTYEIKGGYFRATAHINEVGLYQYEFVLSNRIGKDYQGYFLDMNESGTRDLEDPSLIAPSFLVLPKIDLDQPLKFSIDNNYHIVSGTVEGLVNKPIALRYKGGSYLVSSTLGNDGSFAFLVQPGVFEHGGELELVCDFKDGQGFRVIAEGSVAGLELDVSLSQYSFTRGIISRNIRVDIKNIPSKYRTNNTLLSNYKFRVRVFEGDEQITSVSNQNLLVQNGESRSLSFEALAFRGLRELSAGEYTVEISLLGLFEGAWQPIYQTSSKLNVWRADQNILINEVLKDTKPKELRIDFGGEDNTTDEDDLIYYKQGKPVRSTRSSTTVLGGYVLRYNVPGEPQKVIHTLRTESGSNIYPSTLPAGLNRRDYLGIGVSVAEIPIYQGGMFEYTLEIYELVDKSYKLVDREIGSFNVFGYQVEIENPLVFASKEARQTIKVFDDQKQPVNNAVIYIGKNIYGVNSPTSKRVSTPGLNKEGRYEGERAYLFVDPAIENIVGGVYEVADFKLSELGTYNIVVYEIKNNEANRMAVIENAIEVKGEEVYSVTIDNNVIRAGHEQVFHIMVRDSEGRQVIPHAIDVLEDGLAYRTINQIEINANQTTQGTRIIHTIRESTEETLVFRVRDETSTRTGQVRVNIANPNIVFDQLTPLITESIKEQLGFVIKDSISQESIENDLTIDLINGGTGTGVRVFDRNSNQEIFGNVPGDKEYNLEFLVTDLNHDEIKQAGVTPKVRISLKDSMVLSEIPVAYTQLYSEPTELSQNATSIKIYYKDAKGQGLAGRDIYINDRFVDQTDSNGQYTYHFSATTNSLDIRVATDVPSKFEQLIVRRVASQPVENVVRAPEIVYSPEVTLNIRYDVPMAYIYINNVKQDYFLPVTSYTARVGGLKPGLNSIYVRIQDMRQNSTYYQVEVYFQEDKGPLKLTIGEETPYGIPTLVLGTTMVPVRFAEDLGAEMKWDNTNKKVTYTSFRTTIVLQEGNSFGYINGVRSPLPLAPYMNEHNRLMVPLRMIAEELGFRVKYIDRFSPIEITVR